MNKIKTIIIDDEEDASSRLADLVEKHCRFAINLLGCFHSVKKGIHAIKTLKPQLVFLDVQIHDETGFDLLQQLPDKNFEVIFVTAYEKYAVQAFKFSAIIVPTMSGFELLPVIDILRCQSDVNYTTIYIQGGQKLVVAKTLKEFEDMLAEYNFFRVHNSHLINLAYVKSYNKGKGGSVLLNDGTEIEVSTRRKDNFLQKMNAQ